MRSKVSSQSPLKITLNHPIYKIKNQNETLVQSSMLQKLTKQDKNSQQQSSQNQNKNKFQKNAFIQYFNGQYYGRTNAERQPSSSGIYIDDQFNFFLSNWKNSNEMHGLTFIKFYNEIMFYGSWIKGHMNGFNVVKIKSTEIYFECKGNLNQIISPLLVINHQSQTAYLLKINYQTNILKINDSSPKFQIINRKSISNLSRSKENNFIFNPNIIFEEENMKIPHHLFSLNNFFNHLAGNCAKIIFKEIEKNYQKYFYLSIQEQNISKNKIFKPSSLFKQQLLQNKQYLSNKTYKNKRLGILINKTNFKTKSIGCFDQNIRLNGIGINFGSSETLLGIFRDDMISKQYASEQNQKAIFKINNSMKKKLKIDHIKSLSFRYDIVYFQQASDMLSLVSRIHMFVNIFQNQYCKQNDKSQDSSCYQNQSFEAKYSIQAKSLILPIFKGKQFIKNQLINNEQRPYGFIVKSRSPLRTLKNQRNSPSPSDIQTLRKEKKSPFSYKNKDKSVKSKDNSKGKCQKYLAINTQSNWNISQQKFNKVTSKHEYQMKKTYQTSSSKKYFKKQNDFKEEMIDTARTNKFKVPSRHNLSSALKVDYSPKRQIFWK